MNKNENSESMKYEQSIHLNYLATNEDAERLGCKVGEPVSFIPEPTNKDEIFERLYKLEGQRCFEGQKIIFSEKPINERTISDKLKELNLFIEDAESLSTNETFNDPIDSISRNRIHNIISQRINERTKGDEQLKLSNDVYLQHLIEYSRLKYGYYDTKEFLSGYSFTFFGSYAAHVLGKYFFFKKWLENELDLLTGRKKLPDRLQTSLTTKQRAKLFTELVNGGFIPDENEDCFNWAIGVTDEKEPTPPGQWQPIEWKKSKEDFVRLFQPILREVSGNEKSISRPHKKIIEALFFDNDNEPMNSLRNPPPKQDSEIEAILRTIGIISAQPFKHKPIR